MDTRLGTMYLLIPKVRKSGYVPFFIVERLARALGIENISASQVSEITKGLEEQVAGFRNWKLKEEYQFLWIDAL